MEALARKHWDAWFNEPIPALGDLTPRQAARTRDGRDLLESLLLDYQRHEENASDNLFKPDIPRLKKELGLK